MTISGTLSRRQLSSARLRTAITFLAIGAAGLSLFRSVIRLVLANHQRPDRFTQIAAFAFVPVMGAIAVGLSLWTEGRTIAEFTCDEMTLRFRRLRQDYDETRTLSEIRKVREVYGRGHRLIGHKVRFRDGTDAFVSVGLENAHVLVDRLTAALQVKSAEQNRAAERRTGTEEGLIS